MTGSAGGKANRTRRGSKNPRPVSGAGSSSPGVLFHPNADEANSPLFRNRFSQIKFGLNPSSPKKPPSRAAILSPPRTFVQLGNACENMMAQFKLRRISERGKVHRSAVDNKIRLG